MPEEDRIREFGSLDNCRRMKDEVFRRLIYIPAGWKVEETHVTVYRSKKGPARFLKGETPAYLLRGSVVTPSLEAAIINGKFVNALPYRRMEKDFERNGVFISEQNMASWTVFGAKASAVIYSIVETAKSNDLNPYYYFEHLLTEIPKLKEFNTPEEEAAAMERLLPWSADLPEKCHKRSR